MHRYLFLASFIFISSLLGGQSLKYPTDEQFRKIPAPELAKPDYLKPVKDPAFGTTMIRITDSAVFGKKNVRHFYSKISPWNCNQSLVMIEKWILDGNTYKILRKMDIPQEARWSFKDPQKIFGVKDNNFISFNVNTGQEKVIHTFTDFNRITIGPGEGNLSWDDRYVAFEGIRETEVSGSKERERSFIVFDIKKKKVLAVKKATDLSPFRVFDWITVSPSGKYVVINFRQLNKPDGGVICFDKNLNKLHDLFPQGQHGDLGYDAAGNEVYVQVSPPQYARLDNGQVTDFFQRMGGHVSMKAWKRPGWTYCSLYNPERDIVAIRLDGSQTVERFAHYRSNFPVYITQPHAVASPDGKKIIFASDWWGTSEVNAYIVYLEE